MAKIPNGKYPAKILDYCVGESQNGDPLVGVTFGIMRDGVQQVINWSGSFRSEKSREISMQALAVMGLKDPMRMDELALGKSSKLLNTEKEVQLTVEEEAFTKDGKTHQVSKVKFVNPMGGFATAMTQEKFAQFLAKNGVKAEFAKQNPSMPDVIMPEPEITDADIPF